MRRTSPAPGSRPRASEPTSGNEPLEEVSIGTEDIDESVARAREIIVLIGLLLCEGDEQPAADVMDPERCKTNRDAGIGEGLDQAEVAVEHLDGAEAEVCRVEEGAGRRGHQREALVHGADITGRVGDRRTIDGDDPVDAINGRAPTDNRAVLGRKEEAAGT